MNKKWLIVMIVCLLVVTIIGVGGKAYMDKKAEQKEAEKIEAERMSVEALKNTFADIKAVELKYTSYDKMVGGYFMTVSMMNASGQEAEFRYSYSKGDKKITSFKVVDKKVQSKGQTTKKIKVTYSNGKGGEV